MTRIIISRITLWCFIAAIMTTVFVLSNQPAGVSTNTSGSVIEKIASVFISNYENLPSESKETIVSEMQHFIRKTAHFTIYCILGIFTISAMLTYTMRHRRRVLTAAAICLAYSASDEFHQLFVSGRSCQLSDVCLDFCGSILGIAIVSFVFYLIIKLTRK